MSQIGFCLPQRSGAIPEKIVRISGNCSLTPRQARQFLGSVVAATMMVSGGMAVAGYWMVLPFAGLELMVLAIALNISMRRGQYQEIVRITDSQLVVEKGAQTVQERVEFPRCWTRVELIPSLVTSHPDRLMVGCMGRSVEIGACLTDSDRRSLERRLQVLVSGNGAPA